MSPIVYLHENHLRDLYRDLPKNGRPAERVAFGWDDLSVFHVYADTPKVRPAGLPVRCQLSALPQGTSVDDRREDAEKNLDVLSAQYGMSLCMSLDDENILEHTCLVQKPEKKRLLADVRFIPEKSELYSRSRGLLETDVLSDKTVLIVGVGSGGSYIATELARAGVGGFAILDFDRLELSNVARHVCGINDLGRYKTLAIQDKIWQINPHANIQTFEVDINNHKDHLSQLSEGADLLICASDNDRSRFNVNEVSVYTRTPALFGRVITRAAGGDVLRVRPCDGPCYNCLFSQDVRGGQEEASQLRQLRRDAPDYTNEEDLHAQIQVGLSSDIAPISNMVTKLALVELSRGTDSGISSLESDFASDFYIWGNRRETIYKKWPPMKYKYDQPSILRWYGARVKKDSHCPVCGTVQEESPLGRNDNEDPFI